MMKRLLFVGALLVLFTGCRLPVDVNIDRYPGLQVLCYRSMDGRPFDGVSVSVLDPQNNATTDANGSATLLVYSQAGACDVTYQWWTRTPMRERTATVRYGLGKGLNVYQAVLNDNPYSGYGKIAPDQGIDPSGIISISRLSIVNGDTTYVPQTLALDPSGVITLIDAE